MYATNGSESLYNSKVCSICGRKLPSKYEGEICPFCEDAELLRRAKDYIRANDVNEYQVAEHFDIPVSKVKAWIRQGRIEYKTTKNNGSLTMHCQRCGAQVTFGTLCPTCLKLINGSKHFGTVIQHEGNHKMRYIDKEDDGKKS